jgi:hypothetical protein
MSKTMRFLIGCLLWFLWGMVMSAVGISALSTPKVFWPIWVMTLVMMLWSSVEHLFVPPPTKK